MLELLFPTCIGCLLSFTVGASAATDGAARPNVLFIVADDLRPALGVYGHPTVKSPSIDKLAKQSVVFTNCYTQQAVCAPSRVSFLTGRRPDTTHLYDFGSYWREAAGNFTTLPQHFKENGYFTASVGKVFHPGKPSNGTDDFPYSWSVPAYHPPTEKYKMAKMCNGSDGMLHMNLLCPIYNISAAPGGSLPDIQSAEYTIDLLRQIRKNSAAGNSASDSTDPTPREPFFVGLGFHKPHIPFKYPAEFLDLYPLSNITPPENPRMTIDLPLVSYEPWTDLRKREDVAAQQPAWPYGPLPYDFGQRIRQNYFAATTYMDSLLGKVLDELKALGLHRRTIITFLGDHGWALGEHAEWAKYSNYEVATNVPLIVHVPKMTDANGKPVFRNELVELVDMFATLSDLANLTVPPLCPEDSSKVETCTEGQSFSRLLTPGSSGNVTWKSAAFSQYPRPADTPQEDTDLPSLVNITMMGYTMRTPDTRYTEWVTFNHTTFKPDWTQMHGRELYFHKDGRHDGEATNLEFSWQYADLIKNLSSQLRKGWRTALPPFDNSLHV